MEKSKPKHLELSYYIRNSALFLSLTFLFMVLGNISIYTDKQNFSMISWSFINTNKQIGINKEIKYKICMNGFEKATKNNGSWIFMNDTIFTKMMKLGWNYDSHLPLKDYWCNNTKNYEHKIYVPSNCEDAIFSDNRDVLLPSNITMLFIGNSHIHQIYSSIIKRALSMDVINNYYTINDSDPSCFCFHQIMNKYDCLVDNQLINIEPLSHFQMKNNAKIYSLINNPLQIMGIEGILYGIKMHKHLNLKDVDIIIINEGNPNWWFHRWFDNKCPNIKELFNDTILIKKAMDNIIDNIHIKLQSFGLRKDSLILKLPFGYDMKLKNNKRYNFNYLNMIRNDSDLLFMNNNRLNVHYKWSDHQCLPGIPDSFAQIIIEAAFQYKYNTSI